MGVDTGIEMCADMDAEMGVDTTLTFMVSLSLMAYIVMAYIVMVYLVMAYTVMAYAAMAYIVMAYAAMAYIVMAYAAMAYIVLGGGAWPTKEGRARVRARVLWCVCAAVSVHSCISVMAY